MATQTGRTVSKWTDFIVDDSGGTLRSIPVDSINGVGLSYDETEVTAFQDAIKNVLPGHADCVISISGPFDNSVAAAVGTLSGSHTILSGIVGGNTPLSLDVQVGIRHAWESGEPQFGITSSATSGFICTQYSVDLDSMKYSAQFRVMGSTAPAWGTAAET
jgi:hypothetical protein